MVSFLFSGIRLGFSAGMASKLPFWIKLGNLSGISPWLLSCIPPKYSQELILRFFQKLLKESLRDFGQNSIRNFQNVLPGFLQGLLSGFLRRFLPEILQVLFQSRLSFRSFSQNALRDFFGDFSWILSEFFPNFL